MASRPKAIQQTKQRARPRSERRIKFPAIVPEVSFVDVVQNFTAVDTGFAVPLSPISIGDGVSNRDGATVHPVHLKVRYSVGTGAQPDEIRVMLVRLLYDQTSFNVNQILESVTAGVAVTSDLNYEFYGQQSADRRFEVLYDAVVPTSPNWQPRQFREVDISLSSANGHSLIRYPTSGAGTTPVMGGIVLVTFCVQALAQACNIRLYSRLKFIDA